MRNFVILTVSLLCKKMLLHGHLNFHFQHRTSNLENYRTDNSRLDKKFHMQDGFVQLKL